MWMVEAYDIIQGVFWVYTGVDTFYLFLFIYK